MKKILLQLVLLFSVINVFAQPEAFDIATFIPPQGWQRLDSNGVVLFHDYRTENGMTSFCQIFIYPSHPANGTPQQNFQAEWANRVMRTTGTKNKPTTQAETGPDGWTAVSGATNVTKQGVTYTCMLVAASGFNKEMSIMINIAGKDYTAPVQEFLEKFDLHANTGTTSNSITEQTPAMSVTPGALSDYIYTAPSGWTTKQYADGIVLSSPVYNTGEKCSMTIFPMRASSGNLQNDATGLLLESFKGFQPSQSPNATQPSMIRGISAQGWEYFIVKNFIKPPGDYATIMAFAFVAKLGNQVAAIVGSSKDPLVSSCFGELQTNVWPKFFYSLQFRNWNMSGQSSPLLNQIPGVWITATATASDRWEFAPNGRFAGASASQRYVLSSTQVMTVTDAYFGDGSYSIQGNTINLAHDRNKSNPEIALIRIEQESRDNGRSWKEKLYLYRKSSVDGAEYEVNYDKQ